jgi:hypothetical protein
MVDIGTLMVLAASVVEVIPLLLQKGLEKGAEEFGKSAAGSLFNRLKQRLTHMGAKKALEDLVEQPADLDAHGDLKMQLCKAIDEDATLAEFLKEWVTESKKETAITQMANVQGDGNKIIQISGSGNSVS